MDNPFQQMKRAEWEAHHYRFGLAGEGQADRIEQIPRAQTGLVLNAGCGHDGEKIARLSACCARQMSIDRSLAMISRARATCLASNVDYCCAEAKCLPLGNASMDHIVALGMFACVADPGIVFREFLGVSKPGAYVLITNSVSHPIDVCREAGLGSGLDLAEEMEAYCPTASGDKKRRYLLAFVRPR